jgi:hypothetical protein
MIQVFCAIETFRIEMDHKNWRLGNRTPYSHCGTRTYTLLRPNYDRFETPHSAFPATQIRNGLPIPSVGNVWRLYSRIFLDGTFPGSIPNRVVSAPTK